MVRLLAVFGLVVWFGGCAMITNSLSPDQISQIRISEVRVTMVDKPVLWWGDAEQEVLAAQPPPRPGAAEPTAQSPEVAAQLRKRVSDLVYGTLMTRVVPLFAKGQRAVILEVEIREFAIPSAAQRVILGGHRGLGAVTTLKDAVTGSILARTDKAAVALAGQGIAGVLVEAAMTPRPMVDRVMDVYVADITNWLLNK